MVLDKDTFERLKQNDPSVTHLHTHLDCRSGIENPNRSTDDIFNSIDWGKDGYCISNNTQLEKIEIYILRNTIISSNGITNQVQRYVLGQEGDNLPNRQQLQDFFSCIYQNRSIKELFINNMCITDDFGSELIEGLCGHHSLTILRFGHVSIGCRAIREVLKHPKSKIEDLSLQSCWLDDEGFVILCDALSGNNTMKRFHLSGNKSITSVGWSALSTVLQHPNCKLIELALFDNSINDHALGNVLSRSAIKVLSLSGNRSPHRGNRSPHRGNASISSTGWLMLFNQLSQTSIADLNLCYNDIEDSSLLGLVNITSLKCLDLQNNKLITPAGWQSFFNTLQAKGTQLVKLKISDNKVGAIGAVALGNLLSNMTALKELEMSDMSRADDDSDNITSQGWVSLFAALQNTELDLVNLDLGGNTSRNTIDDEGMQLLVPLVSSMSSLHHLSLRNNRLVSPTGSQLLTGFFQSPSFILKSLDLDGTNLNDDTVIALTNALAGNKTLETLGLEECRDEDEDNLITERGWAAVSNLLCNKLSIMDTYNSNHIHT